MRAMVVEKHGPPECLRFREVPDPDVDANHVLIKVMWVGVNFADLLARMGLYPDAPKPPFIPGLEVSGIVEKAPPPPVGRGKRLAKGSAPFEVGERVAALASAGAYAERVSVDENQVFRVPEGIPLEDAAAIPVNYLTAYHALYQMGNLEEGDRVLIHGAAGGVGIAAVQLAKARKLVVFGTAGPSKQEALRKMGVDHPINSSAEDFEDVVRQTAPGGIEMVMDPIGGKSFSKSCRCLGSTGRLVVYGFSAAVGPGGRRSLWRGVKAVLETPRFNPLDLMRRNLAIIGVNLGRMESRRATLHRELKTIFQMYASGQIKPVISKTFPLEEAAEAHRYIHSRQSVGKVLLAAQ